MRLLGIAALAAYGFYASRGVEPVVRPAAAGLT